MLPGEITGIRDLLSRLENDVVYALADTATKRALAFTSVNGGHSFCLLMFGNLFLVLVSFINTFSLLISDAIDAIILHSESAYWLLNRKKLTRALLFEYLNARKIPVSGQAEKSALITRAIELWNSEPQHISAVVSPTTPCSSQQDSPTPEMGLKFTQWFYEMLYSIHKQSATTKLSEQFWRDARLKITLNSSDATDCQEAIGAEEVFCCHSIVTHAH